MIEMNTTTERLALIVKMSKYNLDLELIKDFSSSSLIQLCSLLEKNQTPQLWYSSQKNIQKELLKNERFFLFLNRLWALDELNEYQNMLPAKINEFLGFMHKRKENASDYPIDRFVTSVTAAIKVGIRDYVFYAYLSCFSRLYLDEKQARIVLANLQWYQSYLIALSRSFL